MTPDDVLKFWFPSDPKRANALWWGKDEATDREIRDRFEDARNRAKAGELDDWAETARGRMALVILLDQMSRNMFRGDPETYAADDKAVSLVLSGLDRGHDRELPYTQRLFFYLPLEHAESLELQERCVNLTKVLAAEVAADPGADEGDHSKFASYVDYAIRHRDIVARFGRFPHRNAVLGRESTPEELAFLEQPGSSF